LRPPPTPPINNKIRSKAGWSDETAKYLKSLQHTEFGEVSLLNLGTHTAGGFPLQVPENIRNGERPDGVSN
jgi:beta-lactamase class C